MSEFKNNGGRVCLSELELPSDLKKLSIPQCGQLCSEIRKLLINTVSSTGGHLASNLGVVELTMSIHRNFNSPDDKIVWDVGHQAYVHKILTGRADRFSTIRQENGLSGFPKPSESVHDTVIAGHSSTSLSAACGIAEAMRLQGKDNYTVAVIGDGAMTGGMVYEAMNNCCQNTDSNLIVVLNDNNMSISKSVGSLEKYLTTLRNSEEYLDTKRKVERKLNKIPVVGSKAAKGMKYVKDAIKSTVLHRNLFEDMGFIYLGPINGHSLKDLEQAMRMAKSYHRPVFVHVKTTKGKGYLPAEKNPGEYHGISRFDVESGNPEISAGDSYSTVFGKELLSLAEADERICAITAAMKYGTGLQYFGKKLPQRFYDVGIAEQHAVTFGGGLAAMGQIPVFAVYSTFLQRAYDQLIHDVAIGGLHLVLGIDRAGIVGEDGETHQGIFDVPMLTTIPDTVIYSPSCYDELRVCLKKAIYEEKNLAAVRYPRGSEDAAIKYDCIYSDYRFFDSKKSDILVISYGRIFNELYKATEILKKEISCNMLKLTKIFPVAEEIIWKISDYRRIIFFEEAVGEGSISEKFGNLLMESGYKGSYSRVAARGFIKQASVKSALDKIGLSSEKMAEFIKNGGGSNGTA
ncbi:MAG: 1-deoxy-D-xylulose-5-phosphate synthase [Ruminococcus sp.]|nr:1-deoxy-D-xylulose-5-phosphate synthase [Ruminococcus sp.]